MTDDNDNARLSEQEVAAFAVTLTKMVRGFGGFMLVAITALGGITAIPYINPPPGSGATHSAVVEVLKSEGEKYARPNKWTSLDDTAAMAALRDEQQTRNGKIWTAIEQLRADHVRDKYEIQGRLSHCEWELERIEEHSP